MDKSYVTLAVCPICHEDNGTLLLDRRLRPKFEMRTLTPEPCDKCKEKYLKNGVLIMNKECNRLVVLKDEVFARIFDMAIPKGKICFCDEEVLDRLQPEQEK